MAGATLEAITWASSKAEDIVKLRETLQMIWDSLTQGLINKAVKKFPKWPKAGFKAKCGHYKHSQWTVQVRPFVAVVWMTLFTVYHVCAWTFLSELKSLGGNADNLTLRQYTIIQC